MFKFKLLFFDDKSSIVVNISSIFVGKFFLEPKILILTPFSLIRSLKVVEKLSYIIS